MKKLLIIITLAFSACNSPTETEEKSGKHEHNREHTATTPALINNNSKWRADEATKKNVAAMMQVVHDSKYAEAENGEALYAALQTKVDTLINECRMQGSDHDALHVWLEKVMADMAELKKGNEDYYEAYVALKKDIDSFNASFE